MRETLPTSAMLVVSLSLTPLLTGCQETPVQLPLPPLQVAGWINGEPPSQNELQDKIVVIDFFATWCGPCRESTPELMELYEKYRSKGVQFIGLTSEDPRDLDLIQSYVDVLEIGWPVGYHAVGPTSALRVEALPTVIVFDPQGNLVLNQIGFEPGSEAIEKAIQEALRNKQ